MFDETIYRETDIHDIAQPGAATGDALVVRLKKEKYVTANVILLGVLALLLVICVREKIHFASIALIIALVLCLSAFLRNYTSPAVIFYIDSNGVIIHGKEKLPWHAIERVALRNDMPEGRAGHMVFYLKDGSVHTAALDSNMDRSVGTIAAWIVKYSERSQNDHNDTK